MATFNCPLNKQDDWVSFQLVDELGESSAYTGLNSSASLINNSFLYLGIVL